MPCSASCWHPLLGSWSCGVLQRDAERDITYRVSSLDVLGSWTVLSPEASGVYSEEAIDNRMARELLGLEETRHQYS